MGVRFDGRGGARARASQDPGAVTLAVSQATGGATCVVRSRNKLSRRTRRAWSPLTDTSFDTFAPGRKWTRADRAGRRPQSAELTRPSAAKRERRPAQLENRRPRQVPGGRIPLHPPRPSISEGILSDLPDTGGRWWTRPDDHLTPYPLLRQTAV